MYLVSECFILIVFYIQSPAIKSYGFSNTGKIILCLLYYSHRKYSFHSFAAVFIRQCSVNNVPVFMKIIKAKTVAVGLITPDKCGNTNGHSNNVQGCIPFVPPSIAKH